MIDRAGTARYTVSMSEDTKTKTDEQILAEHQDERTKCAVFTRCMGYHRPVETFNAGKQGEFEDRAHFEEPSV